MSSRSRTCAQCGKKFYNRLGYILCEHCINIALYGYDPCEDDTDHTSDYDDKSFEEINKKLLVDCRRADACGKSYGYYTTAARRWKENGFRE